MMVLLRSGWIRANDVAGMLSFSIVSSCSCPVDPPDGALPFRSKAEIPVWSPVNQPVAIRLHMSEARAGH